MENIFNPLSAFKKFNNQWEQQANDFIHTVTNNEEFVKFSKVGADTQARFMEMFSKNQELIANQLNLPTKKDVANVAKLSIQTDEKLDLVEEQIWKLQHSVDSSQKEWGSLLEVSQDMLKLSKQLKTDLAKTQKELSAAKGLSSELEAVKSELSQLTNLKEEISFLRELLAESLQANVEPKGNSLQDHVETK